MFQNDFWQTGGVVWESFGLYIYEWREHEKKKMKNVERMQDDSPNRIWENVNVTTR